LHVRSQCAAALLREVVAVLPGVVAETIEVAEAGSGDDGLATVTCSVAPGIDPTSELGERLQKAAIAVHELKLVMPTLEEYFYSITDGLDHQEEIQGHQEETDADEAEPVAQ
jgi:hypothetical protein